MIDAVDMINIIDDQSSIRLFIKLDIYFPPYNCAECSCKTGGWIVSIITVSDNLDKINITDKH